MTKRNQRKRQREVEKFEKENDEKSAAKRPKVNEQENDEKSPAQHPKVNELPVKNQAIKSSETLSPSEPGGEKQDEEKAVPQDNSSVDHIGEVKMEPTADEEEEEEDPEEDPEEDEEMEDASPQHHSSNENSEEGKSSVDPLTGNEKDELNVKEPDNKKAAETKAKNEADAGERIEGKVDSGKKETPKAKEVVDKELLQVSSGSFLPLLL